MIVSLSKKNFQKRLRMNLLAEVQKIAKMKKRIIMTVKTSISRSVFGAQKQLTLSLSKGENLSPVSCRGRSSGVAGGKLRRWWSRSNCIRPRSCPAPESSCTGLTSASTSSTVADQRPRSTTDALTPGSVRWLMPNDSSSSSSSMTDPSISRLSLQLRSSAVANTGKTLASKFRLVLLLIQQRLQIFGVTILIRPLDMLTTDPLQAPDRVPYSLWQTARFLVTCATSHKAVAAATVASWTNSSVDQDVLIAWCTHVRAASPTVRTQLTRRPELERVAWPTDWSPTD